MDRSDVKTTERKARLPISVLVLHGYRILADELRSVLQSRPDFERVEVVSEPSQALAELERQGSFDVVVFDILSCDSPVRFVRELRSRSMSMKLLPMSVSPQREIVELIESGACGYVPLSASLEELLKTICQVHRKQAPCCPRVVEAVFARLRELSSESSAPEPASTGLEQLTSMESKVLELLARGGSNRELGRQLGLSVSTVKMHVRSLLGKLRVDRRQDAVRVAAELGLLDPLKETLRRPA